MDVVCTPSSLSLGFSNLRFLFRRNTVVLDFITWLRKYNEQVKDTKKKTGFYGIDLYSLEASREAVLNYLEKADPSLFSALHDPFIIVSDCRDGGRSS